MIIKIDRSVPFDHKTFIGKEWSVVKQDKRAITLTEIDLTDDKTLKKLDAGIFKTLWENQILIPEKWKEKTNGSTTYFFFHGTVFGNSHGRRCVLYLYWHDEWRWSYCWLGE